ncbi:PD-(D/E)XK nuclease family protein [Rhizobium sp. RHZ01]|uniref:PD-(D/E)XK nuclease family protein n=1 Tax=Rhizobium sp. RHZ01 TaxID=2769304 RepID=UPI00177E78F0|nr:PD-(D/E)XK nuclease family protein [Rhizobium sp. RHZ01]MBD9449728.1 PD-(D/E)XK nuclease family protein [Rhizobium sp. RHZ01]
MSATDEITPRASLIAAPVAVRDIHKTVLPIDTSTATVSKDVKRDLTALTTSGEFIELEASVNRFCPFEAMGMVRAEIRHGNALSYLLDPERPHGFGTAPLRAFLQACFEDQDEAASLLTRDGSTVRIRREWQNIDMVLVFPASKTIIAIELKIDAFQGETQLAGYRQKVERWWRADLGWSHRFVFLTKRGEAAKDGWGELQLGHLAKAFDALLTESHDQPAAQFLRDYLSMLKRHHVGDENTRELARKLWAEHGDTLQFLIAHRPDPMRNLFEALGNRADELASSNSTKSITLVPDKRQGGIVRWGITQWDSVPGLPEAIQWTPSKRILLIEVKNRDGAISAYMYCGPSPSPTRSALLQTLEDAKILHSGARRDTNFVQIGEQELFRPDDPLDFDSEDAMASVQEHFRLFVEDLVVRIDHALRPSQSKETVE